VTSQQSECHQKKNTRIIVVCSLLSRDGFNSDLVVDGPKKGHKLARCLGDRAHFFAYLNQIAYRLVPVSDSTFPITAVGSNGRCNTIWYKAVFKGGVYETEETVWAFSGAETRRVASEHLASAFVEYWKRILTLSSVSNTRSTRFGLLALASSIHRMECSTHIPTKALVL
jgi:hypothetical protein